MFRHGRGFCRYVSRGSYSSAAAASARPDSALRAVAVARPKGLARGVAAARKGACIPAGCGSSRHRNFATAVYTVPAHGQAPEQVVFLVGLNERKFFGQDGAEEGLKLLERIAEHDKNYTLLFGVSEQVLDSLEEDYKVVKRKLTPSRDLESVEHGEVVPIMQAGMVDDRPRHAIGKPWTLTQRQISDRLLRRPLECVWLGVAFWQHKRYRNADRRRFMQSYFPESARPHYEEHAELMASHVTEFVLHQRLQGSAGATVVTVGNEIFDLVHVELKKLLERKDVCAMLAAPGAADQFRARSKELCKPVMDMGPLIIALYVGLPLFLLQQVYFAADYYVSRNSEAEAEESRD